MTHTTAASGGFLSLLGRFPWMLLIIAYLLVVEYLHLPMTGNMSYGFIAVAVGVFFIEMFKSGDVGVFSFFLDQLWAILSLVLAAGLMSYLIFVEAREPSFYHWLGCAMIVADALLNPVNAYRTALRNLDVPG